MNPTVRNAGGSPVYEREGRYFVEVGIGTIGWGVYPMWREIDFDGKPIGINSFPMPEMWIFPDPAVVAAEKAKEEAKRQWLDKAKEFPVEGMLGNYDKYGDLCVWPANDDGDEHVRIATGQCAFCLKETPIASVSANYYEDEIDVCRECLDKMFDVFNKKVTG